MLSRPDPIRPIRPNQTRSDSTRADRPKREGEGTTRPSLHALASHLVPLLGPVTWSPYLVQSLGPMAAMEPPAKEAKTEEATESNHAVEMKASVPAGVTRLTTYTCRLCLQPCGLVGSKKKGSDPKIREEDRCASICRSMQRRVKNRPKDDPLRMFWQQLLTDKEARAKWVAKVKDLHLEDKGIMVLVEQVRTISRLVNDADIAYKAFFGKDSLQLPFYQAMKTWKQTCDRFLKENESANRAKAVGSHHKRKACDIGDFDEDVAVIAKCLRSDVEKANVPSHGFSDSLDDYPAMPLLTSAHKAEIVAGEYEREIERGIDLLQGNTSGNRFAAGECRP